MEDGHPNSTESDRAARIRAQRIANLGPPWRKGQSGNPKGRRPLRPITDAVHDLLNGREAEFLTYSEAVRELAIGWVKMSVKDSGFLKELLLRIEGQVPKALPAELPPTTVIVQSIMSQRPGTALASQPDATTLPGSTGPVSSLESVEDPNPLPMPMIGMRVEVRRPMQQQELETEDDEQESD